MVSRSVRRRVQDGPPGSSGGPRRQDGELHAPVLGAAQRRRRSRPPGRSKAVADWDRAVGAPPLETGTRPPRRRAAARGPCCRRPLPPLSVCPSTRMRAISPVLLDDRRDLVEDPVRRRLMVSLPVSKLMASLRESPLGLDLDHRLLLAHRAAVRLRRSGLVRALVLRGPGWLSSSRSGQAVEVGPAGLLRAGRRRGSARRRRRCRPRGSRRSPSGRACPGRRRRGPARRRRSRSLWIGSHRSPRKSRHDSRP